jgi:predicted nucleic acid-binding Zn ribbon protein
MDTQKLAALEEAIKPYRRAGFVITSQSEGAITLAQPRAKFSYLLFILLLLVWPLALLYLISFNNQRERSVCLRVTSQGQIEESGYTLELLKKERRRERQVNLYVILPILIVLFALSVLLLWHLTYGR